MEQIFKISSIKDEILTESDTVFSFPVHSHSYCEMLFYEPFEGYISINEKRYRVEKNTAIIIYPFHFHEISVSGKSEAKYMKIAFDAGVIRNFGEDGALSVISEADDYIKNAFCEIISEKEDLDYSKSIISALVLYMKKHGEKSGIKGYGYEIISDALRKIQTSFTDDIGLSDTAKSLSVSPQYLSKLFKSVTGIKFVDYISKMRLRYAKKLIFEENMTVNEACILSGYKDYSAFFRAFKREFGVAPSKIRRKQSTSKA